MIIEEDRKVRFVSTISWYFKAEQILEDFAVDCFAYFFPGLYSRCNHNVTTLVW